MAGWEDLGQMIAGGGKATYEKAYNEGRFRSAQTEDALTQARINQAKAVDQELTTKQKTELLANPASLKNPNEATLAQLLVGDLGANYQAASTGMGTQQNIRFKDQVANVGTSNEQRLRDLQAIEGKPSADVQAVGANDYVNLSDDLQVPTITDSAQAKLDAGVDGTPQVQNYKFLTGLGAPPGPETFGNIVRGPAVINAGGVTYERPGLGNPTAPIKPLVAPGTVATNLATNAQAKAEGTALGGQVAAAPGKIDKAEAMLSGINDLLKDPGFDSLYGKSGAALSLMGPMAPEDYRQAKGRLGTLDAQSFGLAIEQMKGLGALSNAEGLKVQQAFTRATNDNLDEDDARVAWAELQFRLNKAVEKARTLSQGAILPAPGAAAPTAASADLSGMSDEDLMRALNSG